MELTEKIKKLEELIEKTKPYEKSQLAPFETQIIYCRKVKKMPYREIKTLLSKMDINVCITTIERFYKRRVKKSTGAKGKQPLDQQKEAELKPKHPQQKTESLADFTLPEIDQKLGIKAPAMTKFK